MKTDHPSSVTLSHPLPLQHRFLPRCLLLCLLMLLLTCILSGCNRAAAIVHTTDATDLVACNTLAAQTTANDTDPVTRIGLVNPANPALTGYLTQLARQHTHIVLCQENWATVLPQLTPITKVPSLEKYYGWGVFLLALLVSLLLASTLTPRRWWTRPTLLGAAVLVGGCWGGGILILSGLAQLGWPQRHLYADVFSHQSGNAAQEWTEVNGVRGFANWLAAHDQRTRRKQGTGMTDMTADMTGVTQSQEPERTRYLVHQPLNLRLQAGVYGHRIATLSRGANVAATGQRDGDWWQVEADVNGTPSVGWVSSLWLR